MGGTYRDNGVCDADIPKTYSEIGKILDQIIPANSQIYWASNTVVPLLYTSNISIYIPQIYATAYYRQDGDSNLLLQQGLWNSKLARQWLAEADFIVTESDWHQRPDLEGNFDPTKYSAIKTVPANPCDPSSYLVVYRRKH